MVEYRNGAVRQRRFFTTKAAAEAEQKILRNDVEQAGTIWKALTGSQRAEIVTVWREAEAAGVRLLDVWTEWKQGRGRGEPQRVRKPLRQVIQETISAKTAGARRIRYVRELEAYLWRFAAGRMDQSIAEITVGDLEAWLSRTKLAPSTRAAEMGRLSALFSHAKRRGYRPDNPVEQVDKPVVQIQPPRILTVEEAVHIVDRCPPALSGWLLLALFAGIRPEELDRIQWEAVDFAACVVTVDAEASKVRARRLVHLRPGLSARLAAARAAGAVLPLVMVTRRRLMRKLRDAMGWEEWPQDVLRHTAASYWLAVEPDVPRLALELGNSPAMIFRHYRELVRREDAERFWAILTRAVVSPASPLQDASLPRSVSVSQPPPHPQAG